MRILKHMNQDGKVTSYRLNLSARETYDWATRPGSAWPCSKLSNYRLMVEVDSNGLCDYSVDGRRYCDDLDGTELDAIVSDHLPKDCRHLWPTWQPAPTL